MGVDGKAVLRMRAKSNRIIDLLKNVHVYLWPPHYATRSSEQMRAPQSDPLLLTFDDLLPDARG